MMSETVKLIAQEGLLVVVAGAFLWAWFMDRKERKAERESITRLTLGFIDTANAFNTTIANHLSHAESSYRQQGEMLGELTKAIERLCIYMEMPNRDYKR